MYMLWKDFPEINRRVAFQTSYKPIEGSWLGCHCGTIANLNATFGSGTYGANAGKNIEVLDTTKEKQLKYESRYGYLYPTRTETDKVHKYLKDIKLKFQDLLEGGYDKIVENFKNLPLWVMSDVINAEAPARAEPNGGVSLSEVYMAIGRTSDFAKYLIENKVGYVLASPIIQNPFHRSTDNYSLNQAWFWIPPNHLARALNVAKASGEDLFPSQEDWFKQIDVDIGGSPESITRKVFNNGVFPESGLFKRELSGKEAQ